MSNPLAITAVTVAFAQLLSRALTESKVSGGGVRLEPPDPLLDPGGPTLNLFLFDVSPHPSFVAGDPNTLGLRLHYLLTSYGKGEKGSGGSQLEAQHILGYAMSYVHDNPMLTRAQVRQAVTAYSSGHDPLYAPLSAADLDSDVELVKLTPLHQTPDDVSRLWAALNQSYRLSVSYEASAVLIKRRRSSAAAPPVRTAGVYALTLARPVIETVTPPALPVDGALTLTGRNLFAPDARVRFGSSDADPTTTVVGATEIVVNKLPSGLRAGPNAVHVIHDVQMGSPPVPHRGFESNAGLFALNPKITTQLTKADGNPIDVARDADLDVGVDPPVSRSQRTQLLLGGRALETLQWPVPAAPNQPPETVSTLRFHIPADHPTGLQLIQLGVDGAESALETDPHSGEFIGPEVQVTA